MVVGIFPHQFGLRKSCLRGVFGDLCHSADEPQTGQGMELQRFKAVSEISASAMGSFGKTPS